MSATSISAFTQAAQQAQQWVNELADELDWTDRRAYYLLRGVLQALRDWLPPQEVADLAAQLPVLIRGIFFEGWDPLASPAAERKKDDFVERVSGGFSDDPLENPEEAITAVFQLLDRHISEGEAHQVRHALKKPLRELWLTN